MASDKFTQSDMKCSGKDIGRGSGRHAGRQRREDSRRQGYIQEPATEDIERNGIGQHTIIHRITKTELHNNGKKNCAFLYGLSAAS